FDNVNALIRLFDGFPCPHYLARLWCNELADDPLLDLVGGRNRFPRMAGIEAKVAFLGRADPPRLLIELADRITDVALHLRLSERCAGLAQGLGFYRADSAGVVGRHEFRDPLLTDHTFRHS